MAVASVDCRSAFAPTRPPHNSRPRDGARPRRGARSRPPRRRRRSPLEPGRAEGRGVAIRARGGGEEPGLKQVSSRHAHALSGNPPRRHHHGGGRREPEVPRRPPGPRRRRRPPVPSRGGEDAQAVQIRTCVLASRAGFPFIRATTAGQGTGLSRPTVRPGAPARRGPPRPLACATPGAPRPPPRRSTPTPRRAFPPVARVERAPRRVLRRARTRDGRAAHVCPRRRSETTRAARVHEPRAFPHTYLPPRDSAKC